jgi:NADPH:quinone reductase-like Zn-dependent oxidoreductase
MKAMVTVRYGSPDTMELREVDQPSVGEDQVLVRVRAASVNAYDWHMLRGRPYLARFSEGLRRPKTHILGLDAAGEVEAIGRGVTHVKVGDRVFGSRIGSFAEYVSGRNFVPMPAGLTFEQAAAVPTAGQTALQAVRDKARVQLGQRVLVNGAGGGVGSFAVQIAKAFGAQVTGATRPRSVQLVASLGADEVIDGTIEDFTRPGGRYDVILDCAGNRSLGELARALTRDGTLVLVGPGRGDWIGPIARVAGAVVRSRLGSRKMVPFLASPGRQDMLALTELIEAGSVRPILDRIYPLAQTPEAIRRLETGEARGKVVIAVSST